MVPERFPAAPPACNRRRRAVLGALTGAVLAPFVPARAANAGHSALVIGNCDYLTAPLRNPVNDARLMADTLGGLGYKVAIMENATMQRTLETARSWLVGSAGMQSRIFYFAGHGVQAKGKNFLVPVDADIRAEEEVPFKAVSAMEIVDRMGRFDEGVNIVILDACRSAPFSQLVSNIRGRGINNPVPPGLAPTTAPRGTLIAYSTAPGAVAADGAKDGHSVYTRHLAQQIQAEGVPVEIVFKRVRQAVVQETRNMQVPWETSSMVGDFCFRPGAGGACGVLPQSSGNTQRRSDDKTSGTVDLLRVSPR